MGRGFESLQARQSCFIPPFSALLEFLPSLTSERKEPLFSSDFTSSAHSTGTVSTGGMVPAPVIANRDPAREVTKMTVARHVSGKTMISLILAFSLSPLENPVKIVVTCNRNKDQHWFGFLITY